MEDSETPEYWGEDTLAISGSPTSIDGALRGSGAVLLSRGSSRGADRGIVQLRDGHPETVRVFTDRMARFGVTVSRAVRYQAMGSPAAEPYYYAQWDLWDPEDGGNYEDAEGGMNLPGAWSISTGAGAVVAVLDTGILKDHPEFASGGRSRGRAAKLLPGYDFVSDRRISNDGNGWDADPSDPGDWVSAAEDASGYLAGCGETPSSWHGSHVAGTIAAAANGIGITGIAPDARILPVRVLGKCGGYDTDIAAAIRWAAGLPIRGVPNNRTPADVINLSLGGWGPGCDPIYAAAIADATAAGSLVVVSAGNSTDDAYYYSPASCSEAVTVAAVGPGGYPSWYTNVGELIDIAAPGGDSNYAPFDGDHTGGAWAARGVDGCPIASGFLSMYHGQDWPSVFCPMWTDWGNNIGLEGYVYSSVNGSATRPVRSMMTWAGYEGTSMAAPHIAGLAALIASVRPSATPAEILGIMQETSRSFRTRNDAGFQSLTGFHEWVVAFLDYYGVPPEYYGLVAYSTWGGYPLADDLRNWGWWQWMSWGGFPPTSDDCAELSCGAGLADAYAALQVARG